MQRGRNVGDGQGYKREGVCRLAPCLSAAQCARWVCRWLWWCVNPPARPCWQRCACVQPGVLKVRVCWGGQEVLAGRQQAVGRHGCGQKKGTRRGWQPTARHLRSQPATHVNDKRQAPDSETSSAAGENATQWWWWGIWPTVVQWHLDWQNAWHHLKQGTR